MRKENTDQNSFESNFQICSTNMHIDKRIRCLCMRACSLKKKSTPLKIDRIGWFCSRSLFIPHNWYAMQVIWIFFRLRFLLLIFSYSFERCQKSSKRIIFWIERISRQMHWIFKDFETIILSFYLIRFHSVSCC